MSRIRQVAICVRDFEPAIKTLCATLDTYVTYRDPTLIYFGLQNALLPLGNDTFLEILSPVRDNVTADRYLKKFGDGGYMALVQVENIKQLMAIEQQALKNKIRIIHRGARTDDMKDTGFATPSNDNYNYNYNNYANGISSTKPGIVGIHLHPNDIGCITEFTNMKPFDGWLWAGKEWQSETEQVRIGKSNTVGICAIDVAVDDPQNMTKKWKQLIGLELEGNWKNEKDRKEKELKELEDVNFVVFKNNTKIRFVKKKNNKENGVVGITVYSRNVKENCSQNICGVMITLVQVGTMSKL